MTTNIGDRDLTPEVLEGLNALMPKLIKEGSMANGKSFLFDIQPLDGGKRMIAIGYEGSDLTVTATDGGPLPEDAPLPGKYGPKFDEDGRRSGVN